MTLNPHLDSHRLVLGAIKAKLYYLFESSEYGEDCPLSIELKCLGDWKKKKRSLLNKLVGYINSKIRDGFGNFT
jgi:hypothetical protein